MEVLRTADAVVVGGGLAGLTAAALLAKAGKQVLLFERSHAIGGRAMTSVENGFHLNLGPHAWYVGGPGTRVLNDLGVTIPGRAPTPTGNFALRRGRLHTLPVGFISLLTTDLLGVHGKLEVARILASLARMDTSPYDDVPAGEWVREHIADEAAREFVASFLRIASYADAPDVLSAGAALASLQSVVKDNVRYVDGGWQSIVDALRARAVALGVTIATSTRVATVLQDGEVHGVRLGDGEIVAADTVVLAVDPATAESLVPGLPARYGGRWSHTAAKAACLDVALSRLPRPGNKAAFGIDRPLYYSVHSATAALAPSGGAVIHVAKYLEPGMTFDAKQDERELEGVLDALQPGWRSVMQTRRYLPSMIVSHGIPTAVRGGLKGRVGVNVPGIEGLFLAGDWVGSSGTLANASVASAARAAELAVRQPAVAGAA